MVGCAFVEFEPTASTVKFSQGGVVGDRATAVATAARPPTDLAELARGGDDGEATRDGAAHAPDARLGNCSAHDPPTSSPRPRRGVNRTRPAARPDEHRARSPPARSSPWRRRAQRLRWGGRIGVSLRASPTHRLALCWPAHVRPAHRLRDRPRWRATRCRWRMKNSSATRWHRSVGSDRASGGRSSSARSHAPAAAAGGGSGSDPAANTLGVRCRRRCHLRAIRYSAA